jgi:hypothetical protein
VNTNQKVVLAVGAAALIGCGIYVPWQQVDDSETGDHLSEQTFCGYSIVNSPPAINDTNRHYPGHSMEPYWLLLLGEMSVIAIAVYIGYRQASKK